MQMRAHLHYLDRIDALELHNVKKERARANGGDDGSDEDVAQGSGSDEDGRATAADIRAANKKKKEFAEKKQKAGENKAVQVKVDSGLEVTATGDVKTSRAAASLFGPAKAAAEEPWIDLPYYESTVSRSSPRVYAAFDIFTLPFSRQPRTKFTKSSTHLDTASWLCLPRPRSIFAYRCACLIVVMRP